MDISTVQNMQRLVQTGKDLLKKPVSRINLQKGRVEAAHGEGTNEEAFTRFAKLLSQERKLRTTQ